MPHSDTVASQRESWVVLLAPGEDSDTSGGGVEPLLALHSETQVFSEHSKKDFVNIKIHQKQKSFLLSFSLQLFIDFVLIKKSAD